MLVALIKQKERERGYVGVCVCVCVCVCQNMYTVCTLTIELFQTH